MVRTLGYTLDSSEEQVMVRTFVHTLDSSEEQVMVAVVVLQLTFDSRESSYHMLVVAVRTFDSKEVVVTVQTFDSTVNS